MAKLEILVHSGCLSEQSARTLAQAIRQELPAWEVDVRSPEQRDIQTRGIAAFPAFLVNDRIVSTGVPTKDWLLNELRMWEKTQR